MTVDSNVLLYFIQYLNHGHLGCMLSAKCDLLKLCYVLLTDIHMSHKETALNLLGWALKQEGEGLMALEIFQLSLL